MVCGKSRRLGYQFSGRVMGGILKLGRATSGFRGGRQIGSIWRSGAQIWPPSLPGISDFYGSAAGEVTVDINPASAVISAGAVSSVPNLGGTGSVNSCIPAGTGAITRTSDLLALTGANYLLAAAPINLMGMRLFMVANADLAVRLTYLMGCLPAGNVGLTNVRFDTLSKTVLLMQNPTGTGNVNAPNMTWAGMAVGLHLFEFDIGATSCQMFVDGVFQNSIATPAAWTGYMVDRFGMGQGSPGVTGQLGRIVGLKAGGLAADRIAIIRAELRRQYPGLAG